MKPCTRVLIALLALAPCAEAAKLRVPQQYQLIQHAMLAANHGDTVIVSKGVYRENVTLSGFRDVTLVGKGRVIIDAQGAGAALRVPNCDRITIRNIRLRNAGEQGIEVVSSDSVTIGRCDISNTLSEGIRIEDSPGVVVERNRLHDLSDHAIYTNSNDGFIHRNTIRAATDTKGIYVLGSRVTVSNNRISDCTYTGITVFNDPVGGDAAHNLICDNEIQAVSEGVHVHNGGAKDNSILDNKIVKTRNAEMA